MTLFPEAPPVPSSFRGRARRELRRVAAELDYATARAAALGEAARQDPLLALRAEAAQVRAAALRARAAQLRRVAGRL